MSKKGKRYFMILSFGIGFLLAIFFLLFALSSCRTVYVRTELPEYEIEEIERPEIKEQSEDVVKLMRYAEKREIQLQNFKAFYDKLRATK